MAWQNPNIREFWSWTTYNPNTELLTWLVEYHWECSPLNIAGRSTNKQTNKNSRWGWEFSSEVELVWDPGFYPQYHRGRNGSKNTWVTKAISRQKIACICHNMASFGHGIQRWESRDLKCLFRANLYLFHWQFKIDWVYKGKTFPIEWFFSAYLQWPLVFSSVMW